MRHFMLVILQAAILAKGLIYGFSWWMSPMMVVICIVLICLPTSPRHPQ